MRISTTFTWKQRRPGCRSIEHIMELEQQIEGILFYRGEPVTIETLAAIFKKPEAAIRDALDSLSDSLAERGVRLISKDNAVTLGTAPELGDLIEAVRKEELSRDIGKAGLETLSIILYKGPVSRAEIDYVRGVNSSFILRNLMIRALIEREVNPKDARSYLYRPTFELLQFLGVTKIEELPDFERVKAELQGFIEEVEEENASEQPFGEQP